MKSYQFNLACFGENDGKLGTFEPPSIPGFQAKRIFYIFDVPKGQDRANHACMNASVVLIAVAGKVKLTVESDGTSDEYVLDNKSVAVFVPEASWLRTYDFSADAVLLAISNKVYAECQYVDDYEKYKLLLEEA